jgi:hypothetical protein
VCVVKQAAYHHHQQHFYANSIYRVRRYIIKSFVLIAVISCAAFGFQDYTVSQTDWSDSSVVSGPVYSWGETTGRTHC